MPIQTTEKGKTFVVQLEDQFSIEDALRFGQVMRKALEDDWSTIILVVTSKAVNTHCLGTLFASDREANARGKTFKVVCEQSHTESSIKRFDPKRSLRLFHSIEEATAQD
jgi:hypothetical protein